MKTKIITLIALLIAGGLNMYAQEKKYWSLISVGAATHSMWQNRLPSRRAVRSSASNP